MKLIKGKYTNKQYADFAVYCNKNGLIIEDKGDYLEAVNPPEPTVEQKQAEVRSIRDKMLNDFEWRISRNNDERELGIEETDERQSLLDYRQYLRDYTKTDSWYEKVPITFEEFEAIKEHASAKEVTEQIVTDEVDNGTV